MPTPEEVIDEAAREAWCSMRTHHEHIIEALAAAGYVIETSWQLIETAPPIGSIFAFNPMVGIYVTSRKDDQWPCSRWGEDHGTWYPVPTHWKPLAAAPKAKSPPQPVKAEADSGSSQQNVLINRQKS